MLHVLGFAHTSLTSEYASTRPPRMKGSRRFGRPTPCHRRSTSMRKHYTRRPLAERFWPKVDVRGPDECWLWTAALDGHGYGRIDEGGHAGHSFGAHRVAWELANGAVIPDGLVIDHLCRNPPCVNPAHLEPVTQRENLRRGRRGGPTPQAFCGRGHPMSGANLYINPSRNQRACRTCIREWGYQRARRLHPEWRHHKRRVFA